MKVRVVLTGVVLLLLLPLGGGESFIITDILGRTDDRHRRWSWSRTVSWSEPQHPGQFSPQLGSRGEVYWWLEGAVEEDEGVADKVLCSFVLSSDKLRPVRSVGLGHVLLYPVNHQGQPADDGGGQHGDHHLGDVGDVLLVDGVSYSHLGIEALHVDDHAGVEDGEAGQREDEDQTDQGEHVDPLVLPSLVQVDPC